MLSVEEEELEGLTYSDLMSKIVGTKENVKAEVAKKLNLEVDSKIMEKLEWLGNFKI
jgi:hypothetical protein